MRFLICIIGLLASLSLYAQKDKVYLKNGSHLKGEILKVENSHVSIDIGEAEPVDLGLKNLRFIRIARKHTRLSAHRLIKADSLNRVLRERKLIHQFRLGVIHGNENENFESAVANVSFDYTLYYPLIANWSIGAGVGYDLYSTFQAMPIAIELRKNWGFGPSPFFTYFRAGMARAGFRSDIIGFSASVKGQEMLAYGIGKEWHLGSNAIQLSLGFRTQSLQTSWGSGEFRSTTDWNLNRLDIKVGLSF